MSDKQYIPLTLADGSVLECEVIGVFPFAGRE